LFRSQLYSELAYVLLSHINSRFFSSKYFSFLAFIYLLHYTHMTRFMLIFNNLCSFQLNVDSFQFNVDLVNVIQHLNHVIVNLDFNVMLLTYVLDKDNKIICFTNAYSSIQFSADADLDHFVIKKQCIHVLFFCIQWCIHVFFFWCCLILW